MHGLWIEIERPDFAKSMLHACLDAVIMQLGVKQSISLLAKATFDRSHSFGADRAAVNP